MHKRYLTIQIEVDLTSHNVLKFPNGDSFTQNEIHQSVKQILENFNQVKAHTNSGVLLEGTTNNETSFKTSMREELTLNELDKVFDEMTLTSDNFFKYVHEITQQYKKAHGL